MNLLTMPLHQRLAYGLLALPLALIGLPLYVYLPTLLVQVTGLDLMTVGTLLLTARLIEAVCDPLLGKWVAELHQSRPEYLRLISLGVGVLLGLFVMLILTSPYWLGFAIERDTNDLPRTALLRICVLVAYLAYGWLSIIHYTLGAQWVASGEPAARLYGVREGLALAGVLLGSVMPLIVNWTVYGLVCAGLIAAGMWTLRSSWAMLIRPPDAVTSGAILAVDPYIKRILAVFFISTIAGSLPASLLGFYVADVLGLKDSAPKFLAIYFSAGALGFAAWPKLALRYSATKLWAIAMAVAALAFAFALLLRADTPYVAWWFGAVCTATGLLLGAEWMLPQSVVATRLAKLSQNEQAGRVFGLWTWAQKMALAIATGVALWGLAVLGYVPGNTASNTPALIALYCFVPAVMKLVAAAAAWRLNRQES
jgi:glycoside/pentoside/hexuronide:cation symporter, GPH family